MNNHGPRECQIIVDESSWMLKQLAGVCVPYTGLHIVSHDWGRFMCVITERAFSESKRYIFYTITSKIHRAHSSQTAKTSKYF